MERGKCKRGGGHPLGVLAVSFHAGLLGVAGLTDSFPRAYTCPTNRGAGEASLST